MIERKYQKRSTKRILNLILHTDNDEEDKKVERLIEIQLNKHGWYKMKW